MQQTNRIIVIGSGLGGLSAGCVLAARGHEVLVLERSGWLGGKAAVLQENGFRFDMGPTILTVPSVLKRVFGEANRRLEDYLDLVRLDPQWRSFFTDGSTLDLVENNDAMAARIQSFTGNARAAAGYRKLIELSRRQHDISQRYFFYRPVGGMRDMFDLRKTFEPGTLGDVFSMRLGRTVGETMRSHVPDARVAQMLDHFTQYVGSSPDASPAVLCGIAHMQTSEGVWYPLGGTRAIPLALVRLATELGVKFQTGTGVRRIIASQGSVTGVETDQGEIIFAKTVVSNADAVRTHRELVNGEAGRRFEKRRRYEPACSGVVLYLGLRKKYDHLLHHNFIFSEDPHQEFHAIYKQGEPAEDPTCYVCAPASTEPEVAPPGGEALYVLVHTPYLRPHHDWSKMFPRYRKIILDKLRSTAGLEDIEERIVHESALTPQDIHTRYHVLNGAIYGIASHGRFLGAFKPNNRSSDLRGLYLGGGAAHPGPGMPMVMMSGWIAADAADHDLRGVTQAPEMETAGV
jgi:diapolycopene oxygenase